MDGSDLVLTLFILAPVLPAAALAWVVRSQRGRSPGVLPLVSGNVLLFATLLSLALAASEAYYRFLYDATLSNGLALVSQRWFERHYRYNNVGIRDDIDYAPLVAAGKTRITVLGDSFAQGHGVPRVEERFVNLLRRARGDWELHFVGHSGMDTSMLTEMLSGILDSGYQVEVVLYAYCLNDIEDLSPPYRHFVENSYSKQLGFFLGNSWALNTWYYMFTTTRNPDHYFNLIAAAYEDDIWSEQARRLRHLVNLIQSRGGQFLVVTFPYTERLNDPRFRAIHARLQRFWADLDVPALDLLDSYAALPAASLQAFPFDGHPNARAHALAAAAIGGWLDRAIRAPYRRTDPPAEL